MKKYISISILVLGILIAVPYIMSPSPRVGGAASVLQPFQGGTGISSTPTNGNILVGNGSTYTLTATSSLGLGTVRSVALSVPTFLSVAGSPITTSGTLAVTLSGTALPTTSGGTGVTSFGGTNTLLYTSSANTLTSLATVNSSILTTTTGGAPQWVSTSTLNIALSDTTGTLSILRGGTNQTAFSLNSLLFYNGTSLVGTSSQPLYVGALNATTTATSTFQSATTTFAGLISVGSTTPIGVLGILVGAGNGVSKSILVSEDIPATSTTPTIDWRQGNQQLFRAGNAAVAITFSNFYDGQTLKLVYCNPSSGAAGALTFSTQVLWPAGTIPTQTTTANKCDVWSFIATQATSTIKIFGTQIASFQ